MFWNHGGRCTVPRVSAEELSINWKFPKLGTVYTTCAHTTMVWFGWYSDKFLSGTVLSCFMDHRCHSAAHSRWKEPCCGRVLELISTTNAQTQGAKVKLPTSTWCLWRLSDHCRVSWGQSFSSSFLLYSPLSFPVEFCFFCKCGGMLRDPIFSHFYISPRRRLAPLGILFSTTVFALMVNGERGALVSSLPVVAPFPRVPPP